jgi:hypothetical protein
MNLSQLRFFFHYLFIDRFKSRLFKNLTFLTAPVKKTIEAHCFSDKKKE